MKKVIHIECERVVERKKKSEMRETSALWRQISDKEKGRSHDKRNEIKEGEIIKKFSKETGIKDNQ